MKRGTIFLALFVLVAGGIVGASLFLRNQPPIEVDVVVDPLIEPWARQAAEAFNNSETLVNGTRRVQVNIVQVVDDVAVWRSGSTVSWTINDHPDGWLPTSSVSIGYTNAYPFETLQPSLAKTPIIFGGYSSRVNVLTDDGNRPLTWDDVIHAAETVFWDDLGGDSNWRFVNLAFSLPDQTMSGLAVLFSGAAAVNDTFTLTGDNVRGDFQTMFEPMIRSVPNFNTIGSDVAAFVARGSASADIGIGPESQWLLNLSALSRSEEVRFSYPEYAFVFDFPLALWQDTNTTSDERAALEAFGNWLMDSAQQNSLPTYGLRPASGNVGTAAIFTNAEQYGIQLNPDFSQLIEAPNLNSTQGVITWFQRTRS